MKNYRETYVRKAEIAQLILLHQLYSLSGSRELIFQGGTALRWCYGGNFLQFIRRRALPLFLMR